VRARGRDPVAFLRRQLHHAPDGMAQPVQTPRALRTKAGARAAQAFPIN
jgi:hypothetical protein